MDHVYNCKVKMIKLLEANGEDVFPRGVAGLRRNIGNTTRRKR